MDFYQILAQAIGIVAMVIAILSFQQKTQRGVIRMQLISSSMFAVNMAMLGATTGALMNVIGAVRSVVFSNKEKFHAEKIGWVYGFISMFLLFYVLTFTVFGTPVTPLRLVIEFLPVLGMSVQTISFHKKEASHVRALGLIVSPSWLIYNCCGGSIGAILCEVFTLISIFVGIRRYDRKSSKKKLT